MIESIAPLHLSESWDNSGLQIGNTKLPAKKIWIALDPTLEVVRSACSSNVDLLITHHPLLFSPLKNIQFDTVLGTIIKSCGENNLSIYSAHTNYDIVKGGVNDILAEKLGLTNLTILTPVDKTNDDKSNKCKIVVYAPVEHKELILKAFFESGSGVIGNYSCCTFSNKGTGTYCPNENAAPYAGKAGEISYADEIRIESVIKRDQVQNVVDYIKARHPYEEMAYDIYPLDVEKLPDGIGRVGELKEASTLKTFAKDIKNKFGLKTIKVAGKDDKKVKKVALCSGSGSSLIKSFVRSGADVYVSGDLKYHDAKLIEDEDLALIDVGHFHSEHIALGDLKKQLQDICKLKKYNILIESCDLEKDPFKYF